MAENNYLEAIEQARKGIETLENQLTILDKKILATSTLARKSLGQLAPTTPGGMDKQIKDAEKYLASLKKQASEQKKLSTEKKKIQDSEAVQLEKARTLRRKAIKERENQLKKEIQAEKAAAREKAKQVQRKIDMNNSLRKQEQKQQEWNFRNMAKSTRETRKAMREREKQIKRESDLRQKLGREKQKQAKQSVAAANKAASADAKQRVNQAALAKNAEMEARANSKLVGAYARLSAQRDIAKRKLLDLKSARKQDINGIKRAQREYDKLAARVNKANDATAKFGSKTMRGMIQGIRNLGMAFGFVGGIYLFADMAKQGFQLAKQLDSLNFAMKTVITDSEELARTQVFLSDITERFGANIVTTTERYTKFLAAAKQSGLSLGDTEKIFGTMTKAAGALGLKTHELEGVYLALEQMLSKGKVTTEELRRQLGERLPGAFGIMANAMNVSVGELDKMLRKGEILSHEALPKFAKAVEKAYGIEQLDRVENLNAAHQRFSNSWVRMIGDITKSEGPVSKALIGIMNVASEVIKVFEVMNNTVEKSFTKGKTLGGSEFSKYVEEELEIWRNINQKRLKIMEDNGELGNIADLEQKEMKRIAKQRIEHLEDEYSDYSSRLAELQKESAAEMDNDFYLDPISAVTDTFGDMFRENKINKMTEMTAKSKEMLILARQMAGMKNPFLIVDDYDETNYDHVINKLHTFKKEMASLKAIRENSAKFNEFTPEQRDAIDNRILKVRELVDEYTLMAQRLGDNGKGWWDFMSGTGDEPLDRGRTYADVLADIAVQKQNLEDSLDHEAPAILDNIDALEKEAEAWERSNKKKKESKIVIEGSLEALENVKSELEDERDRLATSATQREYYNLKISETEDAILKLTRAYSELDEHFIGDNGFDFSMEGTGSGLIGDNKKNNVNAFQQYQRDKVDIPDESVKYSYTTKERMNAVVRGSNTGETAQIENIHADILQKTKDKNEELLRLEEINMRAKGNFNQEELNNVKSKQDEEFELLKSNLEREEQIIKDSYELRKELIGEFQDAMKDLVVDGGNAIMDARVENVEEDIALNKERYAEILASKEWSEEQRDAIEAERDAKEAQLEKKKRKREKEAFLVKQGLAVAEIAINLAQTISAINLAAATLDTITFGFGGAAYRAANIPVAIGTAAAQTGLVLAQTLPKFKDGTENAPKGWAVVDEVTPEVHTDKFGNIKSMGEDKANFRYLEAGDKIKPSREEFFGSQGDMQKAVWNMNMNSNGRELSKDQVDVSLLSEIKKLRNSNSKVWKEVKKLAGRPVNVKNEIKLEDNRHY